AIDPASSLAGRLFRVSGIRVNANALSGGTAAAATPIVATISVSPTTALPISNPSVTVAFVQSGLSFSLRNGDNATTLSGLGSITPGSGPIPAGNPSASLRFSENFPTAAKTRTGAPFAGTDTSPAPATQNVPGAFYNSESGLTFTLGGFVAA